MAVALPDITVKTFSELSTEECRVWEEDVTTFIIDVETNTSFESHRERFQSLFGQYSGLVPTESDSFVSKFGLSALTDITDIAILTPQTDLVPYRAVYISQSDLIRASNMLEGMLTRPVTIINHNVVFDLRILGLRFGIELHPDTRVHDTILRDTRFHLSFANNVSDPLDLMSMASRHGVSLLETTYNALKGMKELRDVFGDSIAFWRTLVQWSASPKKKHLVAGVSYLAGGDLFLLPVLSWMRDGFELSDVADVIQHYNNDDWGSFSHLVKGDFNSREFQIAVTATRQFMYEKMESAIRKYVVFDVYLAYAIYESQEQVFESLVTQKVTTFGNKKMIRWEVLPQLVEDLSHDLAIRANWAIHGMPVDTKEMIVAHQKHFHNKHRYASFIAGNNSALPQYEPVSLDDELNTLVAKYQEPFEGFTGVFMTLYYYKMLLASAHPEKKASFTNITKKPMFVNTLPVSLDVLRKYMVGDELEIEYWSSYLVDNVPPQGLNVASRTSLNKSLGEQPITPPDIDLERFIYDYELSSWAEDEVHGRFVAKTKIDFIKHLLGSSDNITASDLMTKKAFIKYYIWYIVRMPIPSDGVLSSNPKVLLTKSHLRDVKKLRKEGNIVSDRKYAMENDTFSFGSGAVVFYLDLDPDKRGYQPDSELYDKAAFHAYAKFHKESSLESQFREYIWHSAYTGCVHSIITPAAVTGRDSSSLPNVQNINMNEFAGFFIGTDWGFLTEWDYSNAENVMAALTGRDNNLAYAVKEADFHMEMAKTYWSDLVRQYIESGNTKGLKALRKRGKGVTFASAYGAGATSLSQDTGIPKHEVEDMLRARDEKFFAMALRKKQLEEKAEKRFKAGVVPTWTPLWNGDRIQLDFGFDYYRKSDSHYNEHTVASWMGLHGTKDLAVFGYMGWNYIQQGGVAAMLRKATRVLTDFLYQNGYRTRVLVNIHDSLIILFDIEEYKNTDLPIQIAKIMCSQMPDYLLEQTTPNITFTTELGPENAQKWGKRFDREYPVPLEEFVNQWGRFKLPEAEMSKPVDRWEAPSWKGDESNGWTLEGEIEHIRQQQELGEEVDKDGAKVEKFHEDPMMNAAMSIEYALQELYEMSIEMYATASAIKAILNDPERVIVNDDKGKPTQVRLTNVHDKLYILATLAQQKGVILPLRDFKTKLKPILDLGLQLSKSSDKLQKANQLLDSFFFEPESGNSESD